MDNLTEVRQQIKVTVPPPAPLSCPELVSWGRASEAPSPSVLNWFDFPQVSSHRHEEITSFILTQNKSSTEGLQSFVNKDGYICTELQHV